jgi:hypothetical protein
VESGLSKQSRRCYAHIGGYHIERTESRPGYQCQAWNNGGDEELYHVSRVAVSTQPLTIPKVRKARNVQDGIVVVVTVLNASVKCGCEPHCEYTANFSLSINSSLEGVHTLCVCHSRTRLY